MQKTQAQIIEDVRKMMASGDAARLAKQHDSAEDLIIKRDIPYCADGLKEHLLDVYYLSGTEEALPVVVNIHGGALIYGSKGLNCNFNFELARRKFAVVSLNYRLLPDVTFSDQLRDILSALSYLPKLATSEPLDLRRVCVVGDSAGGLLSFMATAFLRNSTLLNAYGIAAVDINVRALGLISPMSATEKSTLHDVLDGNIVKKDEPGKALTEPTSVITSSDSLPPVWLMTSEEDFIRQEPIGLKDALVSAGVPHTFVDYPKGSNGYSLEHVFPVAYPNREESQDAINQLCTFLRENLVE